MMTINWEDNADLSMKVVPCWKVITQNYELKHQWNLPIEIQVYISISKAPLATQITQAQPFFQDCRWKRTGWFSVCSVLEPVNFPTWHS